MQVEHILILILCPWEKQLNKITFEKDTCIEIEPTDSIDNLTNKSFSFSIWVNPNEEEYEQFIISRPPIGLGITYTPNNNLKFMYLQTKFH